MASGSAEIQLLQMKKNLFAVQKKGCVWRTRTVMFSGYFCVINCPMMVFNLTNVIGESLKIFGKFIM